MFGIFSNEETWVPKHTLLNFMDEIQKRWHFFFFWNFFFFESWFFFFNFEKNALLAPNVVIYDNACHLLDYSLNREPHFFSSTLFKIDRLHQLNHTTCCSSFSLDSGLGFKEINSSLVEQKNHCLSRLRSQLSYMTPNNFLKHTKLFLFDQNVRQPKFKN